MKRTGRKADLVAEAEQRVAGQVEHLDGDVERVGDVAEAGLVARHRLLAALPLALAAGRTRGRGGRRGGRRRARPRGHHADQQPQRHHPPGGGWTPIRASSTFHPSPPRPRGGGAGEKGNPLN